MKTEPIKFPRMPDRVLTEAIPCPACGAAAGEACRGGDGAAAVRKAGTVRVHLGRTVEAA